MKGKLPIKLFDFVVIALSLGLTAFSAYSVYLRPQNTTRVTIEGSNGQQRWIYPLDAEVTLPVPGPLGNTVVRIHNNQAWVESSPCDNKICVAAGYLRRNLDFAACLPNNVFVMIEGQDDARRLDGAAW